MSTGRATSNQSRSRRLVSKSTQLIDLPTSILIRVFSLVHTDAAAVPCLARMHSAFVSVSRDPTTWFYLLELHFPNSVTTNQHSDFKRMFIAQWQTQVVQRRTLACTRFSLHSTADRSDDRKTAARLSTEGRKHFGKTDNIAIAALGLSFSFQSSPSTLSAVPQQNAVSTFARLAFVASKKAQPIEYHWSNWSVDTSARVDQSAATDAERRQQKQIDMSQRNSNQRVVPRSNTVQSATSSSTALVSQTESLSLDADESGTVMHGRRAGSRSSTPTTVAPSASTSAFRQAPPTVQTMPNRASSNPVAGRRAPMSRSTALPSTSNVAQPPLGSHHSVSSQSVAPVVLAVPVLPKLEPKLLPSGVFCLDNCISIKFVPFVENLSLAQCEHIQIEVSSSTLRVSPSALITVHLPQALSKCDTKKLLSEEFIPAPLTAASCASAVSAWADTDASKPTLRLWNACEGVVLALWPADADQDTSGSRAAQRHRSLFSTSATSTTAILASWTVAFAIVSIPTRVLVSTLLSAKLYRSLSFGDSDAMYGLRAHHISFRLRSTHLPPGAAFDMEAAVHRNSRGRGCTWSFNTITDAPTEMALDGWATFRLIQPARNSLDESSHRFPGRPTMLWSTSLFTGASPAGVFVDVDIYDEHYQLLAYAHRLAPLHPHTGPAVQLNPPKVELQSLAERKPAEIPKPVAFQGRRKRPEWDSGPVIAAQEDEGRDSWLKQAVEPASMPEVPQDNLRYHSKIAEAVDSHKFPSRSNQFNLDERSESQSDHNHTISIVPLAAVDTPPTAAQLSNMSLELLFLPQRAETIVRSLQWRVHLSFLDALFGTHHFKRR